MIIIQNLIDKSKLEMVPTRMGFGKGLVAAGEKDKNIVALCCDLTISTQVSPFQEKFPDRYIEVGIAEQNMAGLAAGLAIYGKIPFITSYAAFNPGRNNEQIRTMAALQNLPIKVCGMHAGLSVGPDGGTHQALEDIALMRVLPRMVVVVPCDAVESQKATVASASNGKPTYLRFGREKSPVITTPETPFEIGKALIFREGKDITIVACGLVVYNSLIAAEELSKEGVECEVINSHTIKPFDAVTVLNSIKKTGCVVSVEEHQIAGGLGSVIAETLSANHPAPQEFIGIQDRFGQSGSPDELFKDYKLDVESIKNAVKKALARKR